MTNVYPELFKQLYERKYCQNKVPKNSLEKVQLLQRKIHQSESNKAHLRKDSILVTNSAVCLKDINQNSYQNLMRQIMQGSKKPHTQKCSRKSQWMNPSHDHSQVSMLPQQKKRLSYTTGQNQRSFSQRNNPNIVSNQLYHSNQYSILKFKKMYKPKNQSPNRILLKPNTQRRAKTPSQNVVIGGRNLETEAQNVRKQFNRFDKQIQKYQRQIQSRDKSSDPKSITHRRKIIRYEKQKTLTKKDKTKTKVKQDTQQRQQNIDLNPWAVFPPDHQYY